MIIKLKKTLQNGVLAKANQLKKNQNKTKLNMSKPTLGILGGGQLGRMLIQSCVNFNVTTSVIDPDSQAPCSGFSNEFRKGSLQDYETVYNFGKSVDLLTIEIENVNVQALEKLEQEGIRLKNHKVLMKVYQWQP